MQTVRFYSSIELREPVVTPVAPIANAETTILEIWSPDYEPLVPASTGGNTQATLDIGLTLGGLTSAGFKIYGTPDTYNRVGGVRWFSMTVATYTAGVAVLDDLVLTMSATGNKSFHFGIGAWRALRITALSSGGTGGSEAEVILSLRTN